MTEAWMVRGSERQELLRKLQRKLYEIEEGRKKREIDFMLAHIILQYLEDESMGDEELDAFFKEILREISAFSRTPEEAKALVAEFLEYIVKSATVEFTRALQHQEISEPQKVFGTASAMTEIPLPGER